MFIGLSLGSIPLLVTLCLTVILVEQNVGFARRAAHCFAMMEKGRVVAAGAIDALTDDAVHRHMAV